MSTPVHQCPDVAETRGKGDPTLEALAQALEDEEGALGDEHVHRAQLHGLGAPREGGHRDAAGAAAGAVVRSMGAQYAYMATEKANEASLRLFTGHYGYSKFWAPPLLVHPVHSHRLRRPRRATVVRLRRLAHVDFFPADIGAVLDNPLSGGTSWAKASSGRGRSLPSVAAGVVGGGERVGLRRRVPARGARDRRNQPRAGPFVG
ncbi:hypothetical protein ACP4OV_003043 [Aristida adscensionis]